MRGIDWGATPLGPVERWPRSLQAMIPAMLASRFAMRILWGPELIFLYNDGYRPILGANKHPSAMGRRTRETYHEIWDIVGPLFERVYAGETIALEDTMLPLNRNGYVEDCYFTLSYSPMRDDDQAIAGVLGVVHETTDRVLAVRRLRTLRALAADGVDLGPRAVADACAGALATLAASAADVPFALLYRVVAGDACLAAVAGLAEGSPAAPERVAFDGGPAIWPLGEAARTLQNQRVPCADARFGALPGGAWPEPAREAVVVPLLHAGLQGFLVVGLSARLSFDAAYADFVDLAASQIAATLAGARSYEEERRTASLLTQLLAREQAALAEAERQRDRLESLFMQAPASICVLRGPEHAFEFINPRYAELIGGREVVGKSMRQAMPELGETILPVLDRVYQQGEPFFGNEFRVEMERGGKLEECFFNFIYQPIYDSGRRVEGIVVLAFEVTEQVHALQRAEQLRLALLSKNQELDQFAYVTSHDLKAPLRGIAALSQWIEEALSDKMDGETRRQMDLLRGRVHRLDALIDGILSYSRAGRVREKVEPVDLNALLAECKDLLAPRAEATITFGEGMPTLLTERIPLQQVFLNLMSNALKHAGRPDVHIEVCCRDAGDFLDFAVSDDGVGISARFHERIWGIFQTLQPRDKVEGTGIGLSVVKKLVESRGGQVMLASEPGAGATFHVLWPKRARESL
jgi:signal transduction histidine kinase